MIYTQCSTNAERRAYLPDNDKLVRSLAVSADTLWTTGRWALLCLARLVCYHFSPLTDTDIIDSRHTEPVLRPRRQLHPSRHITTTYNSYTYTVLILLLTKLVNTYNSCEGCANYNTVTTTWRLLFKLIIHIIRTLAYSGQLLGPTKPDFRPSDCFKCISNGSSPKSGCWA